MLWSSLHPESSNRLQLLHTWRNESGVKDVLSKQALSRAVYQLCIPVMYTSRMWQWHQGRTTTLTSFLAVLTPMLHGCYMSARTPHSSCCKSGQSEHFSSNIWEDLLEEPQKWNQKALGHHRAKTSHLWELFLIPKPNKIKHSVSEQLRKHFQSSVKQNSMGKSHYPLFTAETNQLVTKSRNTEPTVGPRSNK